ncbi:MAG: hypothetical protein ISQ20_07370 [Alphaproteobacteria bacterium]|jgi:D-beta-D-heptose 7-phosphate kinase/D-beta-D-heptose 1-phosphate adenosyltransferase|nr:hypothetical protein [Alphaproteobacteria bacterium]
MIHVIGDIILDCYINGGVDRVSPEAPVPIVNIRSQENRLGGAGNVASVLSDFKTKVKVWTSFASDDAGETIKRLLLNRQIEVHNFKTSEISTRKTRILAGGQQVVRLDEEKKSLPISNDALTSIASQINPRDQVIISDYDKGLLPFLGDFLYALKQKKVETYIDPKGSDFGKYKNCFLIKPNMKELRLATLEKPDMDIDAKVGLSIQNAGADACLLTKSADGMSLYSADKKQDFDIISSEVYDVTGAGDTVIAALAFARSKQLSLTDAASFSNYCAAYAVTKIGCAQMDIPELTNIMSQNEAFLNILPDSTRQ